MMMTTAHVFSEIDVLETEIRRKADELERLTRQLSSLRGEHPANDVGLDHNGHSTVDLPVELESDSVLPLAELERRYILKVLNSFGGNRTHTARALGIGTNTLWRKLKAWGEPPARS